MEGKGQLRSCAHLLWPFFQIFLENGGKVMRGKGRGGSLELGNINNILLHFTAEAGF